MPQTVWITGAGSGIGAAMARHFAQAGYGLALTARREATLHDLVRSLPGDTPVLIEPGDITDREGMAAMAQRIAGATGSIDVLCNNAGLNIPNRRWRDLDWASWDEVLRVNITGALNVIAACLPVMRAQGGG